ncbi:MAG: hypothetical protein VX836_19010 [Pseudomonadota bacterium]|jgi:hypothetical protein|nr:hypothetical protein [Pseudomonadota bacterium]
MNSTEQLEKAALDLAPADRVHRALAAWECLVADQAFATDPRFDPEGLALAQSRDSGIASGATELMPHAEFHRQTDGTNQ